MNPPATLEQALQFHRAGRLDEAAAMYLSVLQQNLQTADALNLLGLIFVQRAEFARGEALIRSALCIMPQFANFHVSLAQALNGLRRFAEAIASLQEAVRLNPQHLDAWVQLAELLQSVGRRAESAAAFERALALKPPPELVLEARFHWAAGRAEEAVAATDRAFHAGQNSRIVCNNAGQFYSKFNQLRQAEEAFTRSIAFDPQAPEPHLNLALALLTQGKFERGWEEYEWRWKCPGWWSAHLSMPQPLWNGEDFTGKRMFLHVEGGFGDTFQLLRYLPMITARGGEVIVGCRPELKTLIARLPGVASIVSVGDQLGPFELQCIMGSLPRIFKTAIETIPRSVPYLFADPARAGSWKSLIEGATREGTKLRVGFVCTGQAVPYPNRSCPIEQLAPLMQLPGVQWFGLQKEISDPAHHTFVAQHRVTDLSTALTDFNETATAMAELDLIISIDSAAAHLAGAMGRPVMVLLPFSASHQWLSGTDRTPWYPTAELFRQTLEGDWTGVIERVAGAIRARL